MKKIHLLGLVFFILSLTSIVQAAKFFVKAEPEAVMLNGTTDYSLEISGYITDTIDGTPYNGKKEIGSLLEFPIDSWLTGGTLIIEDSTGTWALYLGGRVALTNPADKMKDSAAMNTWLHKTVLRKIAENGGNIPKELLD